MSIPGNSLPEGWARAALHQIVEPRSGKRHPIDAPDSQFVGMEHVQPHTMRLLGTVPAASMRSAANVFEKSDVLYGRLRPYLNKVCQPEFGGLCSGEFIVLPESSAVAGRFLKYRLNAGDFVSFAEHLNNGDRPRVDFDQLAAFPISLPPRAEQERIADALDELLSDVDAGVEALARAKVKLKLYRASVLKAAVTGGLTADWRVAHPEVEQAPTLLDRILKERRRLWEQKQLVKFQASGKTPPPNWKTKYEEPVAPDASKLSKLPEEWCWATLDQLSELITSGSRGWKEFYSRSGALFIRSQDIRTDAVDLGRMAYVSPPPNSEGNRTAVKKSDVLITITGANVGKAALVDDYIGEAYVSQHVGLVRLVIPEIGHWLHQYATTPSGGRAFLLEAAYGAGKPGLNLDNLKTLPVPLPSEKEQAQIVALANEQLTTIVDVSKESIDKITAAGLLRQAVLQAAFAGNLIPQCPEDEPALALLERIAAERVERERVKRRKPKKQSITKKKRTS